ncbi:MAG: S41 family peptidase [Kangiellaceae bacterium]|nr:S41 family peptidase [Kangiellaceae bacterium]
MMSKNISILAFILIAVVVNSGCKSEKVKKIIKEANIKGTWTAPAYGVSSVVTDNEIILYQFTSDYCQEWHYEITYQEFVDSSSMSDDLNTITATFAEIKQPGFKMDRQDNLPSSCANGLLTQKGDSNYQFDPQQELDVFWQTFNEHYAFFDIEEVDWDNVYTQADAAVTSTTSEEELFIVLSEMIEPLKDFHAYLFSPTLEIDFIVNRKPDIEDIALQEFVQMNNIDDDFTDEQEQAFEAYFEEQVEIHLETVSSFFEDTDSTQFNEAETIFWNTLPGNIGYIYLSSMETEELGLEDNNIPQNITLVNQTFDRILDDLGNSNGIIIDVRTNEGGDDFVGRMLTSRLIDSDLYVYSKQARLGTQRTAEQRVTIKRYSGKRFSGPVVALTSTTTSSAAETFALTIRARDNAQIIGEATGGGLSDTLPKSLPHGIHYSVPNEFYISADGLEFEGVGVPVDQPQSFFTLAQRQSETDLGLSAAIEWVNSQQ